MVRLGADRSLWRLSPVFMRQRIPRQTGNGAVLTGSPADDGGAFSQCARTVVTIPRAAADAAIASAAPFPYADRKAKGGESMSRYVIDLFRGSAESPDTRRLGAKNDADAIAEADAVFATLAADPRITSYRLRNPAPGSDRI